MYKRQTWYIAGSESWDIDQWQMVTATFNPELIGLGDPLKIYKNARLIGSGTPWGYYYSGVFLEADALANVGRRPNYGGEVHDSNEFDFEGIVDGFTVWKGTLSQKEISELLDPSVATLLLGDLDYDGDVDILDFKALADDWLWYDSPADLDGRGVGFTDLAIMAENLVWEVQ